MTNNIRQRIQAQGGHANSSYALDPLGNPLGSISLDGGESVDGSGSVSAVVEVGAANRQRRMDRSRLAAINANGASSAMVRQQIYFFDPKYT